MPAAPPPSDVAASLAWLRTAEDPCGIAPCFSSPHASVRRAAAVAAGRLAAAELLPLLRRAAADDESQDVRREAASAVGRLSRELPQAFGAVAELADHRDPGVVLQAARALAAALRDPANHAIADATLQRLACHPNEIVREFVQIERARALPASVRFNSGGGGGGGHADVLPWLSNVLVHGDVLQALGRIPDDSVHLTFTSPPYYNARDYSTYRSYEEYLRFLEHVFTELHRVTKEGRFFVLNTSPVIVGRAGRQHESSRYGIPFDLHPRLTAAGWKFIDDIVWRKPSGAAKPRNSGFAVHRQPLTYKANAVTEYLMVYRKRSDRLIDWNLRQYPRETRDASLVTGDYEASNVWDVDPAFDRVHSAVFPRALCERVIAYYSMIGDLVFDPFAGSGTLGEAARALDRQPLLCELDDRYAARIQHRLNFQIKRIPVAEFGAPDGR